MRRGFANGGMLNTYDHTQPGKLQGQRAVGASGSRCVGGGMMRLLVLGGGVKPMRPRGSDGVLLSGVLQGAQMSVLGS